MLAWLRLMRLPAVFTAISNVLCGCFIASPQQMPPALQLWLLALTTAGLYLGGMVLNDVFDAALDAVERPERPIPSGQISRRAAAIFGTLLLLLGIAAAACLSASVVLFAVLTAAAVLAYNGYLKSTPAGPFGMAACRFLNFTLGAGVGLPLGNLPDATILTAATALAVYIIGVTWFARNEAGTASRFGLIGGLLVLLSGIAIDAWLISHKGATIMSIRGGSMALLLLGLNLTMRAAAAITRNVPRLLQQTVGLMLLCLIFLDAVLVFALTGSADRALTIILLIAPAVLLKRVIPMS